MTDNRQPPRTGTTPGPDQSPAKVPGIADFSGKAIKLAVLGESLTHPLTIFPGVLGLLGGVAWGLFGPPALLVAGIAGVAAGLSSFIINFCFRDRVLADKYLKRLSEQMARRDAELLDSLEEDLLACVNVRGAEQHAHQGADQFRKVREKYEGLQRSLEEGLGTGGDLHGRVWGTAEQVYLGVLDNLRTAEALLRSVGTIDLEYIFEGMRRLSTLRRLTEADKREMEALEKRKAIRDEQLERVNDILALNEEAITRLEEVTAAIAAAKTGDSFAQVGHDIAIDHLRELAEKIRLGMG